MQLRRFFFGSVFLLTSALFLTVVQPVQAGVPDRAASVAGYYKSKVKGIILKENRIIAGQIVAFQKNGIIFRRCKEGPFYTPQPEYIPMHHIQAFTDVNGKPVWGTIPKKKKYDFLRIRNYHVKCAVQYGVGQSMQSYTFSPLITDRQNYVQNLQRGNTLSTQLLYFTSPHLGIGVKYLHHHSKADIYSLASAAADAIQDHITIQNYMFNVSYFQSISRMVIFSVDVAVGALFYENRRQFAAESAEFTGTSFSATVGSGVDFMITRTIGFGFELSYLFGAVTEPTIQGSALVIGGSQKLNRFDINSGFKFYF